MVGLKLIENDEGFGILAWQELAGLYDFDHCFSCGPS